MTKSYTIRGISVTFPYNAYPSQLSMMSKIITGLIDSNNCLLESPTGSGKSLALLCSTLAWQAKWKKAHGNYKDSLYTDGDSFEENCSGDSKRMRSKLKVAEAKKRIGNEGQQKVEKPPVIIYCTRTHKQIKQIISELKKLPASDNIKMTILSSREHSCIYNDNDSDSLVDYSGLSKNERCKKLLDSKEPGDCHYYSGLQRSLRDPQKNQNRLTLDAATWDIEDLIKHGKKRKVCPYFMSKEMQKTSEIIFCPYNYVIDPKISLSMDLNLEGSVVILDEAHNIEDVARSAGSLSSSQDELETTWTDLKFILSNESNFDPAVYSQYAEVNHLLSSVIDFLVKNGSGLAENQFSESSKTMNGQDFLDLLQSLYNLTLEKFKAIESSVFELQEMEKQGLDESSAFYSENLQDLNRSSSKKSLKLSGEAWSLIESLLFSMKFMFKSAVDFKIVLIKKYDKMRPSKLEKHRAKILSPSAWHKKSKRGVQSRNETSKPEFYETQFHIWCMNPSTVFNNVADKTRCIILASGTLAPLDTFSSELGCKFPVVLEAAHVIKKDQIYVGALSKGTNPDISLKATYQNTQTLAFQDEVGSVLYEICSVIPHGVLFFLSSYKLLTLLTDRWRTTGLLAKLNSVKPVFLEPQKGGGTELNRVIDEFHVCIRDYEGSGALLIAVCRGKVSEGIDFADNEARAVVTLGIPYPNLKDLQIEMKRSFNDQYCASRNLLSGGDWYEIQAFRALNQALGRCIRHRNDWGAVILIDDRFVNQYSSQKNIKNLPKWIRGFMNPPKDLKNTLKSLECFVASQIDPSRANPTTQLMENVVEFLPTDPVVKSEEMASESGDESLSPVIGAKISPEKAANARKPNLAFNFSKNGVNKRKTKEPSYCFTESTPLVTAKCPTKTCEDTMSKKLEIKSDLSDSSSDAMIVSDSPIPYRQNESIEFKYPVASNGTLKEKGIHEEDEFSEVYDRSLNLFEDQSFEALESDGTEVLDESISLKCAFCFLDVFDSNDGHSLKIKQLQNGREVLFILKKILPASVMNYLCLDFEERSLCFFTFASLDHQNLDHFRLFEKESDGLNLNGCYCSNFDIVWTYLVCSKLRSEVAVCGIRIVKPSSLINLPEVLFWSLR